MFHTASVLLLLACGPLSVMSLTCLRCPNVNSISACNSNVACAADEHCYTEKRFSGTLSDYYSMGCVKSLYCPSTDTDVVIGKKDTLREDVEVDEKLKREALCFKCCSTDNCNLYLCDDVDPTEKPEAFTNGTELEIRLVGGYTKYEGNVEVFHNATWGGICDDYWSELHAQIVCSMLGFQKSNALAIKNNSFLDTSYTPFWLDDVKCPSNATILWHCTHRAWGSNDCNRGEKAGVKCYPAFPPKDDFIFLLDTQLQEFLKVDISSQTYDVIPTDMKYNPKTFDYDRGQNKIFFFDDLYKQILSIYSDGSGLSIIKQLDFNSDVSGIAVDPLNDIVFYSDNGLVVIAAINVDGSNHRYVISSSLNSPRSVALLPESQKIFWTEWGVLPKIESADYDGTGRTVLATTNLKWPNSLTIDYSESRLYFVDGGMGTIESMDLEGSFRRVILHDPVAHLFSLDVFSEYIYFTALEKSGPYKVRKDGSGLSPIGPQDFNHMSQIKFYKYGTGYRGNTEMQQRSLSTTFVRLDGISSSAMGSVGVYANGQWRDVCVNNWNDPEAQVFCSMLGFNRESHSGVSIPFTSRLTPLYIGDCLGSERHVAGCPSSEVSNWHLLNCTEKATLICFSQKQTDFQIDKFLIFFNTSTKDFIRMDLNTNSYTRKFFTPENITSVVYDPFNQRIYYNVVDKIATTSVIKSTDLITSGNSSNISNIFSESDINSLAIDTNSHTIFYTDVKKKLIGALLTSGSGSRVVLTGINQPRYITVDKLDTTIFWTEWGPVPKIEKANYDGTNRRSLVTTGLRYPNGIAVDPKAKLVYFCDAGTHSIEVMNTDGSNRRVLFTDLSSSLDGLTITSKYIYYSDKNKRHVLRLNRDGTNHTSAGPPDFPQVIGLHAYDIILN
ncbi:low-density lipoprotein receptor-related protein 6-like isoform X2 [Biomphalaria glabrata]|uniref:Low-density lipoprotein receptor-related protein 6-like isoform X2 n=1 Tax=Biomphalaria glabrata TaxID=6526 RepID=A0A9W3BB16_BIOGL|nr:low-density lipoprotein receptor-related protein 6-like isoform X2 [Biomphalaria glabrata]